MYQDSNHSERPRLEPEIIPPARGRRGPVGLAFLMLLIGIVIGVITLAVVGAILIWIPVLALLLGAGVVYRMLRQHRG
jgi:Zn-dependent membrane protease YugP